MVGANGNLVNLAGQVFGYLMVMEREGRIGGNAAWRCRCRCGQEVRVRSDHLRLGRRKACAKNGHYYREAAKARPLGLERQHPAEYGIWEGMRARCRHKTNHAYRKYGGAGVTVHDRWAMFKNFLEDMGKRPTSKHTLDRYPDPFGNYEPTNCRWATRLEQARNRRDNVYIEYNGERMLLVDFADRYGVGRTLVYGRLKNGWPLEKALTTPVGAVPRGRKRKGLA